MRNVAILMQSRTGSSLVASIFRAHGWNTGGDGQKSRDYATHENKGVRKYLVKTYGTNLRSPVPKPAVPDTGLQKIVARELAEPWAWKGDVFFAEVFKVTFPDLAWIYVKRKIEDAVRSALGSAEPSSGADELWAFLRCKYDLMVDLETEWGGKVVYTTDVMKGIFHTAENAITYAGGEWDEETALSAFNRPPRL